MTNYIFEHKQKRIDGYISIRQSDLKIGQIVWFKYPPSKNNNNPHVLVLNTNFNGLLHGLVIDYMSLLELEKLRNYIIQEAEEVDVNTPNTIQDSLYVLSKVAQTPLTFYESRLKKYLVSFFSHTSIYRTYKLKNITDIRLVIYNFNKKR